MRGFLQATDKRMKGGCEGMEGWADGCGLSSCAEWVVGWWVVSEGWVDRGG